MIAKIKTLNSELEEFEDLTNSYDDTHEKDENFRDEKALWLAREDMLRTTLAQQLSYLCQDVFTHHHQPQPHPHRPHVPRQLWGHSTLRWQSAASTPPPTARCNFRTDKIRRTEKLSRWIKRKMPLNLMDLDC